MVTEVRISRADPKELPTRRPSRRPDSLPLRAAVAVHRV